MGEYHMDDPELVKKAKVDAQGRLYLGGDYANKDVRIAIEVLEEDD